MEKNLLSRVLTEEASQEEKEEFFLQLEDNKEQLELFYEIKSLWLRATIGKTKVDSLKDFEAIWDGIQRQSKFKTRLMVRKVLQYAAILLLIFVVGGIGGYFISENTKEPISSGPQKYTAQKGSISTIELADGTKIWLNSGSELTYSKDYKEGARKAKLIGEAYFEVAHDDHFPFLVEAGNLIVRDLGTTFNIKAYPGDRYIETALIEGKADILNENGRMLLELSPGESATYLEDAKEMTLGKMEGNIVSAWREGKFVIRNQRLENIFEELSRWYDVEFQFETPDLKDVRFTGSIKRSTTVDHVMKMLKLSANFNYRIIEKETGKDVVVIF